MLGMIGAVVVGGIILYLLLQILPLIFGFGSKIAELVLCCVGLSLVVVALKMSTVPLLAAWRYVAPILGPTLAFSISRWLAFLIAFVLPILFWIDSLRGFKFISWMFRPIGRLFGSKDETTL